MRWFYYFSKYNLPICFVKSPFPSLNGRSHGFSVIVGHPNNSPVQVKTIYYQLQGSFTHFPDSHPGTQDVLEWRGAFGFFVAFHLCF